MTLLDLQKISKNFGAIKALTDVDLTLQRGEIVGLMGDNGAGAGRAADIGLQK